MKLLELVKKTRSYRRFYEDIEIKREDLENLIELARFVASGRNAQPLKYKLSVDKILNDKIFKHLSWAGFLTDWKGPERGERPAAYIVIVHDKTISNQYYCDQGIAAQTIMLGASENGFGGCMIAAFNKRKLSSVLELKNTEEPILVLALGKPKEEVRIVDLENDYKYWRDKHGVHYVPKRKLSDLIL